MSNPGSDMCLPLPASGSDSPLSHQSVATSTLLHIEDDPWSADIVRAVVSEWSEIRHVGVAVTGSKGLELCRQHRPDVVLLDLRLPDMDGFALSEALATLVPTPVVLWLTVRADEYTLYRCTRASVRGLVWKNERIGPQLRLAISEALAGRRYFPPEVAGSLAKLRQDPDAFFKMLTVHEIELLRFLGRGETDQEIAARMGLSGLTVKWHRRHIMAKLGLNRTVDLMQWARGKGFAE